ncbi:MAG: transposase [bacterium]|nr:transposase [bacterium]
MKTDRVDALLVARIGARDDDLLPARSDGHLDDLRCLVGYCRELVQSRTGHVNRFHGDLENICCG